MNIKDYERDGYCLYRDDNDLICPCSTYLVKMMCKGGCKELDKYIEK